MALLKTDHLTPMQLGRLNKALDGLGRYDSEIRSLRQHIATLKGEKKTYDGMCDWNRRKFNQMTGKEQQAYEARLKAKTYYTIDGWVVPKIVFDAVVGI